MPPIVVRVQSIKCGIKCEMSMYGLGFLLFHAVRTCMTRFYNQVCRYIMVIMYIYNRLLTHDQPFLHSKNYLSVCFIVCTMYIDLINWYMYFSSLPYRLSSLIHKQSGFAENSFVFFFLISLHFRHFCSKTILHWI